MRKDWIEIEYKEVITVVSGKSQKNVENKDGNFPIYGSGGAIGFASDYLCEAGTTIIGRKGTINSPIYVTEKFWNIDTAFGLYPNKSTLPKFNYFFCQYFNFKKLDKSTAVPSLAKRDILKIQFSLAPLPEQRAIVSKIEELFSSLDNGVANLEKAQAQLKVYRQAVLKKAFEGELTREWREKQTDLPSAEELLEQIKEERERYYNKQLDERKSKVKQWEKNGKAGRKPSKPAYSELKCEEIGEYSIPDIWTSIKSEEIFSFVTSGSRGWAKYYSTSGSMFIRITNLNFNTLCLDIREEKMKYVSLPNDAEGKRTKIEEGDFLFSITGYLGMFAIAPKLADAYVNQHISLARPYPFINSRFIGYWIISKSGGIHFLNMKRKGATKAGLGLDDIKGFPILYCSQKEQSQIVQKIESRLSVCDKVEESIAQGLQKAKALKQSILKKAFEGKLLTETELEACRKEVDWEPAEVLLERVKKEKL